MALPVASRHAQNARVSVLEADPPQFFGSAQQSKVHLRVLLAVPGRAESWQALTEDLVMSLARQIADLSDKHRP